MGVTRLNTKKQRSTPKLADIAQVISVKKGQKPIRVRPFGGGLFLRQFTIKTKTNKRFMSLSKKWDWDVLTNPDGSQKLDGEGEPVYGWVDTQPNVEDWALKIADSQREWKKDKEKAKAIQVSVSEKFYINVIDMDDNGPNPVKLMEWGPAIRGQVTELQKKKMFKCPDATDEDNGAVMEIACTGDFKKYYEVDFEDVGPLTDVQRSYEAYDLEETLARVQLDQNEINRSLIMNNIVDNDGNWLGLAGQTSTGSGEDSDIPNVSFEASEDETDPAAEEVSEGKVESAVAVEAEEVSDSASEEVTAEVEAEEPAPEPEETVEAETEPTPEPEKAKKTAKPKAAKSKAPSGGTPAPGEDGWPKATPAIAAGDDGMPTCYTEFAKKLYCFKCFARVECKAAAAKAA